MIFLYNKIQILNFIHAFNFRSISKSFINQKGQTPPNPINSTKLQYNLKLILTSFNASYTVSLHQIKNDKIFQIFFFPFSTNKFKQIAHKKLFEISLEIASSFADWTIDHFLHHWIEYKKNWKLLKFVGKTLQVIFPFFFFLSIKFNETFNVKNYQR